MIFDPVIHPLLIALAFAVAAALTLSAARTAASTSASRTPRFHAGVCAALRLLALAAFALLLLNPVHQRPGRAQLQRRSVTLLVDTSSSMCVDDESDGRDSISRLDRLRQYWLAPEFLARLADQADTRLVMFDEKSRPVARDALATLAATGAETRLVEEALTAIRTGDASLGSIVLLTDGRDTAGADAAALIEPARQRGIAVSSVLVGTKSQQPDLNVRLSADQAFVHEGQSTTLRAEIDQVGLQDRNVTAILERNGRVIDSAAVVLGPQPARLSFNVTPVAPDEAGQRDEAGMISLCEFRLRVEPLAAESRTDNNASYAFVQITRQHIRIALFENEPYWDTRYLIDTLRSAAEIDLITIIGLGRREEITRYVSSANAAGEGQQQDVAPTTLEQLRDYDVVILGRGVERWFPGAQAETLVTYVFDHGGSLVLARGRPFGEDNIHGVAAAAALEPILPVQWAQEQLGAGRLHAARSMSVGDPLSFGGLGDTDLILSHMPGMIARTRIEREKAASIIWARTEPADGAAEPRDQLPAAVATQQVGHGRVLAVLVDGLWRWALLPPNQADYDPVFPLFWTRAVRWLAGGAELLPGQSVGLSLSRLNVQPGSPVEITVQTRYVDASRFDPMLTVISPDGREHPLEPVATNESGTRRSARYTPADEGLYTVRLDTPGMAPPSITSRFVVHDPSRERLDISADHGPLTNVAHATGGRIYSADDPQALLDDVQAEAVAAQSGPVTEPAWDRPWLLALMIGLLALEWFWRRATGQI